VSLCNMGREEISQVVKGKTMGAPLSLAKIVKKERKFGVRGSSSRLAQEQRKQTMSNLHRNSNSQAFRIYVRRPIIKYNMTENLKKRPGLPQEGGSYLIRSMTTQNWEHRKKRESQGIEKHASGWGSVGPVQLKTIPCKNVQPIIAKKSQT